MDAKFRKIVTFLSKNQDEYDSADISMALKMNDVFVEKALEILEKYGTINCRRDENGNAYWSAPSKGAKIKEPKMKRGAGDDFDDDEYTGRKASGDSGGTSSIVGYIITAAVSIVISAVLSLVLNADAAGSKLREFDGRLETLEASTGNRVTTLERKTAELEEKVDSLARPPVQPRRR
ncbi:MAG: hypothetical protein LBU70_10275 [Chitinispirillales bacterium]|jgi:hypothetical protein|nr:hypothetical protein [Chitinispirillales bacterium]